MLDKRIKFDERYDSIENEETTLYFTAPATILKVLLPGKDYPDAVGTEISLEFPLNDVLAYTASVSVSPTRYVEKSDSFEDYDWNDIVLPEDEIEELIKLANSEPKPMRRIVVKAVEEECPDTYWTIDVPLYVSEASLKAKLDMAKKYSTISSCDSEDGYDEHFEEMLNYKESNNGESTFNYYIKNVCGFNIQPLEVYFEYEW